MSRKLDADGNSPPWQRRGILQLILFSQELRKQLGLEDQALKLWARNGHVEVLSETTFLQKQEQSKQTPEQDLAKLRAAGLKC